MIKYISFLVLACVLMMTVHSEENNKQIKIQVKVNNLDKQLSYSLTPATTIDNHKLTLKNHVKEKFLPRDLFTLEDNPVELGLAVIGTPKLIADKKKGQLVHFKGKIVNVDLLNAKVKESPEHKNTVFAVTKREIFFSLYSDMKKPITINFDYNGTKCQLEFSFELITKATIKRVFYDLDKKQPMQEVIPQNFDK